MVQEEYRQVIKDVQKNADKIVNEKDKEIERLLALNKELRNEMKVQKARNIKNRGICLRTGSVRMDDEKKIY